MTGGAPESLPIPPRPIRVMIVDDSAIIRALMDRILKADAPHVQVCGTADNGQRALDTLEACDPDVMILDIEMPVMDGITALPRLLAARPHLRVLICSTLSDRGAAISVKALSLGAAECLLKPTRPAEIQADGAFHQGLIRAVRHIGAGALRARLDAPRPPAPPPRAAPAFAPRARPQILAIGCSTGGPGALGRVLPHLKGLPAPIVITQHMPATFTRILAEHLTATTGVPCVEGAPGAVLEPGRAYLAPGGRHMLFAPRPGGGAAVALSDGPPENFCRPAADPMLRSLVPIYGAAICVAMLTGLGQDGCEGARAVVQAGGQVIAQDEATSVVWGMPGAVARAGLARAVVPLDAIAREVRAAFGPGAGGV